MSSWESSDDGLFEDENDKRFTQATQIVWVIAAMFAAGLLWAWLGKLDEVATGTGRVVPTSREQVIQSLEGGILAKMFVRQDDIVEPGQVIAQLDPTQEAPLWRRAQRSITPG